MSRLSRAAAASAVVLLSVVMVMVVVLHLGAGTVAQQPSDTPSIEASVQLSPSEVPTASVSQEPQAVFAQIEQQVRALRGLPAPDIGPVELIGRAKLEAELKATFEADYPVERQRADNITLRALGLLKPDQDVAALQLHLLSGQVIGFYDDKKKRMVVVSDAGVDGQAKITYAHEYTHALQDKAFGLKSLELDAVGEDDRGLARLALVEGDATASMLQWAVANLSPDELAGVAATPVPDMSGIPAWMVQQLEFPYTAGLEFVSALGGGLGGDYSAVNDALTHRPPASTEQVIHLDKYRSDERPMQVAAPDPAAALGAGWKQVESTPLGEAMIGITLGALGSSVDTAQAAAGWGGDRLVVASGPDGGFALAWRLKWDTSRDAEEFVAAYDSASVPFPSRLVALSDDEVLVVHASSQGVLDKVVAASQ